MSSWLHQTAILQELSQSYFSNHVDHLATSLATLAQSKGADSIVFSTGNSLKRHASDDMHHDFRSTPWARWLVPQPTPKSFVEVTADAKVRYIQHTTSDFWHASPSPPPDWVKNSIEFRQVEAPPSFTSSVHFQSDGTCDDSALTEALEDLRRCKTKYEVANIAIANLRALNGHDAVKKMFDSGISDEYQLYLAYLEASQQLPNDEPYPAIIGVNENAGILHYEKKSKTAVPPRSLLIDAGATHNGYASDITRTLVNSKYSHSLFADLLRGVIRIQELACKKATPGLSYEVLHNLVHTELAQLLLDLSICRGTRDELVANNVTRSFFPHGLGHSIGLQVHDVGCRRTPPASNNQWLRYTAELAIGDVVTIEPGCYFIPTLLRDCKSSHLNNNAIQELLPFGGIRIEDEILLTAEGALNITRTPNKVTEYLQAAK